MGKSAAQPALIHHNGYEKAKQISVQYIDVDRTALTQAFHEIAKTGTLWERCGAFAVAAFLTSVDGKRLERLKEFRLEGDRETVIRDGQGGVPQG